MTKRPDPHLERIARALGEASARSKLGRWMTANHDDFAALLDEHGANWTVLTDTFKAEGLMPADAKAATAKRTWQRVRQRVRGGRGQGTASRPFAEDRIDPASARRCRRGHRAAFPALKVQVRNPPKVGTLDEQATA